MTKLELVSRFKRDGLDAKAAEIKAQKALDAAKKVLDAAKSNKKKRRTTVSE